MSGLTGRPDTLANWTPTDLIKVVRDILETEPTVNFATINVDDIEVVELLHLKNALEFDQDAVTNLIGKSGAPAFSNAWVNYSTGTSQAGYWKDPFGVVHLQGVIMSGTLGVPAFTLPPGYRPDSQYPFGTISNGAVGRVDVFSDGTVVPASPTSNIWVSLNGITFRAS